MNRVMNRLILLFIAFILFLFAMNQANAMEVDVKLKSVTDPVVEGKCLKSILNRQVVTAESRYIASLLVANTPCVVKKMLEEVDKK